MKRWYFLTVLLIALQVSSFGQYFGRNKVVYKDFDFQVVRTENFLIHHYFSDTSVVKDAVRMSERWYNRLNTVLKHRFHEIKPLIFYANQADFQQTNITEGFVDVGTGGFTESLKSRLVMPFANSYASTDHVIGHEMVHEFQYDIIDSLQREGDTIPRLSQRQLNDVPLWMIEGMAEYLSIGRRDPHTAMYLRDAMIHDKLPSLRDLTRRPDKYFPYRYGEAFWAFIGGRFGDDKIPELFKATLQYKMDTAFKKTLGINTDSVSKLWKEQIKSDYTPLMAGRDKPEQAGNRLLAPELHAGRINLDPVLSPDGKYIAYLSEKELISIDLYIADAKTGKNIRKLTSTGSNEHYDNLNFINSSGTWSPDGKKFAFIVFSEGRNKLMIFDVQKKRKLEELRILGVDALADPSWSPDGNYIAFSGMKEGTSDLYLLDLRTKELIAATNDRYADIQPAWSPDGNSIVFVTDRGPETDFDQLSFSHLQLAQYDFTSKTISLIPVFEHGKHINPQYSADGKSIYFISDQDGCSNIYRIAFAERTPNISDIGGVGGYSPFEGGQGDVSQSKVFRVTNVMTGVSGITEVSPAMSIAMKAGTLAFSVYENNKYIVYTLPQEKMMGTPVHTETTQYSRFEHADVTTSETDVAGYMSPVNPSSKYSFTYLDTPQLGLPKQTSIRSRQYRPKYSLDYIGQGGGVTFSSFGTGVGGDMIAIWSDLLGNQRIGGAVVASEVRSFKDVGGQAFYQYLKTRVQYGLAVGHIPFTNAFAFQGIDTIGNFFTGLLLDRIYIDQAFGTVAYPFSVNRRIEFNGGYTQYSYGSELDKYYIDGSKERIKLEAPPPLHLYQTSIAYVGDYSFFGFTSPIKGSRYRFELQPSFGSLNFWTGIADIRKYFFEKPFTFAMRGMYVGRYGRDAMSPSLQPLYLGYETWVRGYSSSSFSSTVDCPDGTCPTFERLFGSEVAIFNAEVRYPLLGVENFGLINFPYLPTELGLFFDGGVAWTDYSKPVLELSQTSRNHIPVFSAGVSSRVNVANVIILNFYYAYPFQHPEKGWHFGFTIFPGW